MRSVKASVAGGLMMTGSVVAAADPDVATLPVQTEATEAEVMADPDRASTSRLVEEIVVTAQKREENLQDVPISVQAFSADALDARGINDAIHLPNVTPGMVYSVIAGFSVVYIRGVGTDAFLPSADASISTYIDGIFFPFTHGLVQSFGAIERVEVLKGPQGTLFGRNSTGGAISVITKAPGDEVEGTLETSYANFDDLKTRAYVNVPLTDTLAFNVSALYNRADSIYRLTDDSPLKDRYALPEDVEKGARARVRWQPSETFDATLSGLVVEQNGVGSTVNQNTHPNPQYRPLGVEPTRPHRTSVDYAPFFELENPVLYGEARYRWRLFDVKALASHQDMTTSAGIDYDNTKAPLVAFSSDQRAKVETQELQFVSNADSPGADFVQWIVGLYRIESRAGYPEVIFSTGRDLPFFTNLLGALQNPDDPLLGLSQLEQLLGNLDGLGSRVDIHATGFLDLESTAGYFQATVQLPYDFALTLGGRYQEESRAMRGSRDRLQLSDTVSIPAFTFRDQKADLDNFSPKVTLDRRLGDDALAYLSYQRGFKSGTYNILNIYTPTQYVKPETVTAVELGIKSELFDRRVRFNAAAFHTEIEDMQVQFLSLLSGGAVRFETAPRARIFGAEFDLLWQVAPAAFPGLVATANGAWLHAEYTDYPAASGFTDDGIPFGGGGLIVDGGVLPGRDFKGNRIVRTPKFSGTTGLAYTGNAPGGSFEIAADVYYNSGFFYTAQNIGTAEEGAYALVAARASYLFDRWNLRITLFGDNLGDELHALNKLPTDIGTWTTYAPPRTYGARLSWSF